MVLKINIKKDLSIFIYILLLFFTFRIVNISFISESLYSRGAQLSFLIICFLVLIKISRREIKWNRLLVYILAICMIMVLSTMLGEGSIRRTISQIYPLIGIYLLLNFLDKDEFRKSLKGYAYLCFVFVVINTIFCAFSLNELFFGENTYVLGVKNQVAVILIFVHLLFGVLDNGQDKIFSFLRLLNFIFSTYIIFNIRSGNNILSWCVLCCLIILKKIKFVSKISITTIFIAYIIFFVLIIEFHIQNLFAGLIVGILHKDLTFSLRTQIWDTVLVEIKNNPVLGYGIQDTSNAFQIVGMYNNGQFYNSTLSAHNTLLQTAYENGILIFIPIFLVILYTSKKVLSLKKNIWKIRVICAFCALLIVMFAEAIQLIVLLDFCILAISLKKLEDETMK